MGSHLAIKVIPKQGAKMPKHITNNLTFCGEKANIKKLVEKYSTYFPATHCKSHDGRVIYETKTNNYGWWNEEKKEFSQRNKEKLNHIPANFKPNIECEYTLFPDFEKIIPIPEILKDFNPCSKILAVAKSRMNADLYSKNVLLSVLELQNRIKSENEKITPEEEVQIVKAINAYKETGYFYWYDRNIALWGTKWNAYACKKISEKNFYLKRLGRPFLI